MNLYVVDTPDETGLRTAEIIKDRLNARPDSVLGLATGNTMISVYNNLVKLYTRVLISFESVKTFNLDEYVGLEPTHPGSFRNFMNHYLFNHVNILPQNIHIPNGMASDLDAECSGYDRAIDESGGIDLQLLGIGLNGHIGFNEPGTQFSTTTHVVELTEATREANAVFFGSADKVPKKALTMGIKNIMHSRCIILIAFGDAKADIVAKALTGSITPDIPASVLQLHPQLTVVLDKKAASKMPENCIGCHYMV